MGQAALADPFQDRAPRLAPDDGGEVARRKADRPCQVLQGDVISVAVLDEGEDLGEQELVVETEMVAGSHSIEAPISCRVRPTINSKKPS